MLSEPAAPGRLPAGAGGCPRGRSPRTVSFFYQSQTLRTKYEVFSLGLWVISTFSSRFTLGSFSPEGEAGSGPSRCSPAELALPVPFPNRTWFSKALEKFPPWRDLGAGSDGGLRSPGGPDRGEAPGCSGGIFLFRKAMPLAPALGKAAAAARGAGGSPPSVPASDPVLHLPAPPPQPSSLKESVNLSAPNYLSSEPE